MAKISVPLDVELVTENFFITNKETFKGECISGEAAKEYYSKITPEGLSLFMATYNPDDEYDGVSFEFPLDSAKTGTIFTIEPKDDFSGLNVTIKGTLELRLRSGVKEYIKSNHQLKIQGVAYMGGSYRGFMSFLKGQNDDNTATWFEVKDYSIK